MLTTYQVSPVRAQHLEQIQYVAQKAWEHTYAGIYPIDFIYECMLKVYSTKRLLQLIHEDENEPLRKFFVINMGDRVIAFAQVRHDGHGRYEVTRMYALPEYHGRGLGSALLQTMLMNLPDVNEAFVWLEKQNRLGCKFYERKGFVLCDEIVEEFMDYTTHMVKYRLIIQPSTEIVHQLYIH